MARIVNYDEEKQIKSNQNKKLIKFTAILLAGATLIPGVKYLFGENKMVNTEPTTLSDGIDAGVNNGNEEESYVAEHVSVEAFDINTAVEVQDIIDLFESSTGIETDANILKIYNYSDLTEDNAISWGDMSDKEVSTAIVENFIKSYDIMHDGMEYYTELKLALLENRQDDVELYTNLIKDNNKDKNRITANQFRSNNSTLYTNLNEKITEVSDKELKDTLNHVNDYEVYKSNAKEYIDLVHEVMDDTTTYSKGDRLLVAQWARAYFETYSGVIKVEYPDEFDWIQEEISNKKMKYYYYDLLDFMGYESNVDCENAIEENEKYVASHAEIATSRLSDGYKQNVSDIKEGKVEVHSNYETVTEIVSNATTTVEYNTEVASTTAPSSSTTTTTTEPTTESTTRTEYDEETTTEVSTSWVQPDFGDDEYENENDHESENGLIHLFNFVDLDKVIGNVKHMFRK